MISMDGSETIITIHLVPFQWSEISLYATMNYNSNNVKMMF